MPADPPDLPEGFLAEAVPNDDAVAFVRSKTPLAASVFQGLLPELKARAIAISGVQSASVARDVRAAIAAVPAGADWDKQKRKIADLISPYVSPGDDKAAKQARKSKAELLLRTHGFQAYAVTQHAVMREQEDIFPWWQYLSMEDEKVRQTHAKLNKLIIPAASPFWHRHSPPWQWGCRCRKAQLMDDEVAEIRAREKRLPPERKTIIEGPALQMVEQQNKLNRGPTEVYDITPDIEKGKPGGFLFEPDSLRLSPSELQKRYDPQTWADFQAWAQKTEVEPGTTVWQWMGGQKTTGKASPQKAAKQPAKPKAPKKARKKAAPKPKTPAKPKAPKPAPSPPPVPAPPRTVASIEAALGAHATKMQQLTQECDALRRAKVAAYPTNNWTEINRLQGEVKAKSLEMDQLLEASRDLVSIPQADRGQVVVTKVSPSIKAKVAAGAQLTERYTHASLMPRIEAKYYAGKRARHSQGVVKVGTQTPDSVVMHEITHATEQQTARVLAKSLAFLKRRAGHESLQPLRKLTGIRKYKAHEMAYEDEFKKRGGEHYMGKSYGGRATELLTMGVERLHRDPLEFWANDPEYFRFVLQTLQLLP